MGPHFRRFVNPLVVFFCRPLLYSLCGVAALLVTGGALADEGAEPQVVTVDSEREAAEPPVEGSEERGEAAEPPVEGSEQRGEAAESPVEGSEQRGEAAEPPVEGSEERDGAAEPPVEGSEERGEAAEPPVEGSEERDGAEQATPSLGSSPLLGTAQLRGGNAASTPPPVLPPVKWSPVYRRFSVAEAVVTGLFTAGIIAARIMGPPEGGPQGGVWVDEDVRNALRSEHYRGRLRAKDVSDVLLNLSVSYALLGDPLINAAWLRKSPDVGIEVGLINAEVLAVTLGTQELTANLVGRERPYGRTCGTEDLGDTTHSCQGRNRYRSYFSGHTSVPFSLAAATCVHHAFIPLSGSYAWLTCSLGFLVAGSSGVLRIASDNHYVTDVLTGAAFGTLVGLTIPLLHYARGNRWSAPAVAKWDLRIVPTYGGALLQGRFL